MIGKLKGLVDQVSDDHLLLDVQGVGYMVYGSQRMLARAGLGEALALLIDMQVREDAISLYGFADAAEQQWFRLLTSVQGVGARVAMALLSALAPHELSLAIASGDKTPLTRANGVGPKLALRIVTELKDKAAGTSNIVPLATATPAPRHTAKEAADPRVGIMDDLLSALQHLGYGRGDAYQAAARVMQNNPSITSLEQAIPAVLKELSA